MLQQQCVSRVSSEVEQRFCKPLVGSSILSPGTNDICDFLHSCASHRSVLGSTGEALNGHRRAGETAANEAPPSQYGRPEAAPSNTCIARGCSGDAAIELPDYQSTRATPDGRSA
jgi:hypothetical protein